MSYINATKEELANKLKLLQQELVHLNNKWDRYDNDPYINLKDIKQLNNDIELVEAKIKAIEIQIEGM